jgi:tetratricopeptide (TPR) repeat protein
MNAADATRLAGDAYSTRRARDVSTTSDGKTRLAQEGYQSKLARNASSAQPDANEFYKIGEKIGDRYEVSAIHHGAMGVVYGCFDHETKLPRALKTVRAQYASDKQVLSMFESEATVWISLEKHPYIVRAYLVERFKNLPYVITEYVRGPEGMEGDLRGWLGHPRLTLPVAVAMALQIAQGMQHAVRKVPNLVHRDLKPANILVNGDGKAMVTDFGLVQSAQSDAGTPAYMSPEQWRGEALDARSDIYSYGCILFEMFTAHRLFHALIEREWERAHLESPPAALASLVPALPGEIDRFVLRCLAKEPAVRPQNWDEIVTFFAEWYHRMTGKAVVLDYSSLVLDAGEWIDASYSLAQVRRYEEMLLACDRAIAIDPNSPYAWRNKGLALIGLNHYEDAIQAINRALVIDQNYFAAWWNKGVALNNLGRNEEAIQSYDRALAIEPNSAAIWSGKASLLDSLKSYEDALEAYDKSLAIDPNDADTWQGKGGALRELARQGEAVQAYDRALAIEPKNACLWWNKGIALSDLNQHTDAIDAFDRSLLIDPNRVFVWMLKGAALRSLRRFEETVEAFDRALAIDQSFASSWYSKGNALCNLKRYAEGILSYDRALAINPKQSATWAEKGHALSKLSRFKEAIGAYDQALEIDANVSAYKGLVAAEIALKAAS